VARRAASDAKEGILDAVVHGSPFHICVTVSGPIRRRSALNLARRAAAPHHGVSAHLTLTLWAMVVSTLGHASHDSYATA
jgi:hypothetical protein